MTTLALWILMNASIMADWGQTRTIAIQKTEPYSWSNPDGSGGTINGGQPRWEEQGPAKIFLGKHPSLENVNIYFIGSLIINNGAMILLPKKYRPYYAGAVTATTMCFVISNNQVGIKIDF